MPLKAGSPIVTETYDWETDTTVERDPVEVPLRGVVIVDGCFLLREDLCRYYYLSILLEANEPVRLDRAIHRQLPRLGSTEAIIDRFRNRYVPGFELYLARENPGQRADYLIDNSDFLDPIVRRRASWLRRNM